MTGDPWADTRKLVSLAVRRVVAHPEDSWAADFAEQVPPLLAEIDRLRAQVDELAGTHQGVQRILTAVGELHAGRCPHIDTEVTIDRDDASDGHEHTRCVTCPATFTDGELDVP